MEAIYNSLIKYAKSIDSQNAEDLVHDAYIKIVESGKNLENLEIGYIILTIKSVFLNKYKKEKRNNTIFYEDLDNFQLEQIEEEQPEPKRLDLSVLTPFEKILVDSLYGLEIFNQKEGFMEVIDGANMLQLSKETKIPYITIRTALKRIKRKLKSQINEYEH